LCADDSPGYRDAKVGRGRRHQPHTTIRPSYPDHLYDEQFMPTGYTQLLLAWNERYPTKAIHKGRSVQHARGMPSQGFVPKNVH
jgi:hypothetical protein